MTAVDGNFWVFIPLTLLFPAVILVFVFATVRRNQRNKQILLKTGEAAEARILNVSDTGVSINHSPRIALDLEVTPKTGLTFNAKIYTVLPRLQPIYYRPGMILQVRYDPNNLKTVVIESLIENAVQYDHALKPLICPSCGGQIKRNVNLDSEKIIECNYCGTLIDLHE